MAIENKHEYFADCSFLEEDCIGFSIRFDFYSHPDFSQFFLSELRGCLPPDEASFTRGELHALQRSDVNIDLVAEALDSVIERISGAPVYLYYDIVRLFDTKEQEPVAKLYVSQYYVCLFTKNIALNSKVFNFVAQIHSILRDACAEKLITLSDCQFITRNRCVVDNSYFSLQRWVNGMAYIDNRNVSFIKKTVSLDGDISCTVDNIFRRGYVEVLEAEGWEQLLESVATLKFQDYPSEYETEKVWIDLINKTIKSVTLCVESTN